MAEWTSKLGGRRDGDAAPVENADLKCSFCGKPRDRVAATICGPTPAVAICNECVDLAGQMMAEERSPDDAG